MTTMKQNGSVQPGLSYAIRTELACARALLDEVEARFASGNASTRSRNLAAQIADELTRVARAMKGWAALENADPSTLGAVNRPADRRTKE